MGFKIARFAISGHVVGSQLVDFLCGFLVNEALARADNFNFGYFES